MKRKLLAVLIGVGTFALGVALAADYYSDGDETPAEVSVREFPELHDCRADSSSFPGLSKPLDGLKKSKKGMFPVKAFDDGWYSGDDAYDEWYGRPLRTMGEPSLLDVERGDTEVYRFLWLRSFHHPVAVRIERKGYSFGLRSIELTGAAGEPGRVLMTANMQLSEEDWCEFTSLLDNAKFWSMPAVDRDAIGHDGAQWILEGVNDHRYHIVDRWSPDSGDYRAACLYLLKLSGRDENSLGKNLY